MLAIFARLVDIVCSHAISSAPGSNGLHYSLNRCQIFTGAFGKLLELKLVYQTKEPCTSIGLRMTVNIQRIIFGEIPHIFPNMVLYS